MRVDWSTQTDSQVRNGTHRVRRALRRDHPAWSEREIWDAMYFTLPLPVRARIDQLIAEGKLTRVE